MEGNWVLKVNTKQKMPYDLYRLLHRKSTKYRNNYCFNNYVEKPKRTIKKIQKAGIKFKRFHREILSVGKKYYKYLSDDRKKEISEAKKRYHLRFWYLSMPYIVYKRTALKKI